MTNDIHPTAIIETGAELGENVRIGPYCVVGKDVTINSGVELISHVVVSGNTTLGENTRIFPFASIGHEPQDLKYQGEPNSLVVGANCTIREYVTINPGTAGDQGKTIVGDRCVFLASSHVAHDCIVGNGVILSNNVMLAGHCKIGNNVIFGGGSAIHQFSRVGDHAFIGGLAGVENDLIPYGVAIGNRAYLGGLNLVGMKRAGISRDSIHNARKAFKELFSESLPLSDAVNTLSDDIVDDPVVSEIVEFVREDSGRAFCTPRNGKTD